MLGSVERAERNRALARLVIAPDVQDVALREWSALDRAVDAGRRAAEDALAAGGADELARGARRLGSAGRELGVYLRKTGIACADSGRARS